MPVGLKTWRTLLAACLVLGLLFCNPRAGRPASAQAGPLVKILPAAGQVALGGTAGVAVTVSAGANVNAFDITVLYNSDLLALESWTPGSYLSNLFQVYTDIQPGRARLVYTQLATPGVSGDGILLNLVFRGQAAGLAEISLSGVQFSDPQGGSTFPAVENGSLLVQAITATATPTPTQTPPPTATPTVPPTLTWTLSPTLTETLQPTQTLTALPSLTPTAAVSASPTAAAGLPTTVPGETIRTVTPRPTDGNRTPTLTQAAFPAAPQNGASAAPGKLESLLWVVLGAAGALITGMLIVLLLRSRKNFTGKP